MQKRSIGYIFSIPLLLLGFSACHATFPPERTTSENELSSQHVPMPLPIFPDEEDSAFDSANMQNEPANPAVWDVSDVDISKIDPTRKLISFTFDDAPARCLEKLMAVYASYNENNPDCVASATLFLNGYLFDNQTPTLLTTALALGFELGNHSYSHPDFTTLSLAEGREEIDRVDSVLSQLDGKKRHLFRPPYGKITDEQKNAVQTPVISWTIDTLDWTGLDEDAIYENVMQNKFAGAIVLLHDGYEHTVQAVKRLLPDLKTAGYQVVSVSQMSKIHERTLYKGKEYIRIRKA